MAILDPTIRRKPSFYTRFATAALVVVIALPAAAIQFVESERVVAPGRDIDLGASRLDATVPFRPEPAAQAPTRAAAAQTSTTPDDFTRRALNKSLIEFADEGDLDGINALLAAGADINAAIDGDGTPLIAAAGEGQIDAVALLLERGADPNLIVRGDGTALIAAADEGHSGVVALLLNRGADVDLIAPGDGTALIAAASEGHAGIVDLLIRRGAQVNLIADGDETALIQASDEGHLDVVKLLVERGADVNLGVWGERWDGEIDDRGRWRSTRRQPELQTPLNRARDEGHAAIVAFLISAGARD